MEKKNLEALFDNHIPAIKVENFCTQEEAKQSVQEIRKKGFNFYEDVIPPIGRIGITQFEHTNKDKQDYFKQVRRASQMRDGIFEKAGFNPI